MFALFRFKLFLFFFFLMFGCAAPEQEAITIYSIGDSMMADYNVDQLSKQYGGDNYPLRGWMQMMPELFNEKVIIHNAAKSGRSSKSFRSEGLWKNVIDSVKAGDYVFIQFAGNDEAKDTLRHTEPRKEFRQNFINYANETRAKGAYPVFVTPTQKRTFDNNGNLLNSRGDYLYVVRELAEEMNVPLLDLNAKMRILIKNLGPEESKKVFMWIKPGLFRELPEGKEDNGHLNEYGATLVAEMAAGGIKELNLQLAEYLK